MANNVGWHKTTEAPPVGFTLRHWRQVRKVSQLDLALEAGISSRHLSFIETGRSQPSRQVVLKLAAALNLSYKQSNSLLLSAGYAPEYRASNLDAPQMERVRYALDRLLEQHEPYPALVVNRTYDILMANQGFQSVVSKFIDPRVIDTYGNVYRLVFALDGLQPFISNWPLVGAFLLDRLRQEAFTSQDETVQRLLDDLSTGSNLPANGQAEAELPADLPILTFELKNQDYVFRFFSTMTTFGTPQDITVQELRIDYLFPADEETQLAFCPADSHYS